MTGRDPRGRRPSGSAGSPGAERESPLLWNVAGLLGEGAGAARDYTVAGVEIDGGDDFQLAGPIDGRVHVSRTNRGLLVDAEFATTLATQCVRCLRDITVPLAFEIDDEALPSLDLKTGKAATLSDEDAEVGVIVLTDHHELDLEPAIRDAILLNQPIAPLDREDCPGLCIVCGLPLDEGDHDHPDDDIDPRLEALRGFVAD
jgi:uncharacterized protein